MRKEFLVRWLLDPEAVHLPRKRTVSFAVLQNFNMRTNKRDSIRRLCAKTCQVSRIALLFPGTITGGLHRVAQRGKGISWAQTAQTPRPLAGHRPPALTGRSAHRRDRYKTWMPARLNRVSETGRTGTFIAETRTVRKRVRITRTLARRRDVRHLLGAGLGNRTRHGRRGDATRHGRTNCSRRRRLIVLVQLGGLEPPTS